ncbi:hypothetical protein CMI37_00430 [Candidatus Pacearchaeota archaeon]|jgi:hypothetical protein|nr:hypothetical protein [Candidatus Pacearchaeota archaeon]|tara:strand:- start:597 stop:875 length:279 start_codon:yes stop_codon:yes gene_type:complete
MVVLAEVSSTDPKRAGTKYELRVGQDYRVYCTCTAWKMGKKTFTYRQEVIKYCKHLEHFMENGADYIGDFVNQKSLANRASRDFGIRAVVLN